MRKKKWKFHKCIKKILKIVRQKDSNEIYLKNVQICHITIYD